MILGQINFGPAGKFSYDVQSESVSSVGNKLSRYILEEDERIIINYLKKSNVDALKRLRKLIEDALNLCTKQTTSAIPVIMVWQFDEAPAEYRALSQHGGDEDWVGFLPFGLSRPPWMESGTPFGCYDVSQHEVKGGTIFIGAHS